MESSFAFLFSSTLIALASMRLNYAITRERIRADQAFWIAWIFLIWSAETVTKFPFFEYYYQYTIEPATRLLVLKTFLASALGFLIGAALYRQARGAPAFTSQDARMFFFAKRWQAIVSVLIFSVGLLEFVTNQSKFSNLLDLRLAAVDGDLETPAFYTQLFLFAQAFLLLVGFSDGFKAKVSRDVVLLAIGGLILHNLSVGGRINIAVAPVLYLIPFVIMASQREDWDKNVKRRVWQFTAFLLVLVLALFAAIKLSRSYMFDSESISTVDGVLLNVLFAIPMYVSDTFIAIYKHASHAREAQMPFGYYTFNAAYSLYASLFSVQFPDTQAVFGHNFYRDTPDPWAWTQPNLIPRLVSDFGNIFWLPLVPISAFVQWLSLYRMRVGFLSVVIRSLMVFSSVYTILQAAWFTSLNVYILFYSILLYLLARHGRRVQRITASINSFDKK